MEAIRAGQTTSNVVESGNGRFIAVINRPLDGGGWVGTHFDITERRQLQARAP